MPIVGSLTSSRRVNGLTLGVLLQRRLERLQTPLLERLGRLPHRIEILACVHLRRLEKEKGSDIIRLDNQLWTIPVADGYQLLAAIASHGAGSIEQSLTKPIMTLHSNMYFNARSAR